MAIRTHAGFELEANGLRAGFLERGSALRELLTVRHLRVDGGTQVAICGSSGSGKTTLLYLLGGLARPWRGSILWDGVDVAALSDGASDHWRRENVGTVFAPFHVFRGMSAFENVVLPLRFVRWSIEPALRARALKLLDRVSVRPDVDVDALSLGERQRVAVARAMMRKPAIILADEPTAFLDRTSASVVADLLCTMCRSAGATLVLTTDDPWLASRLDAAYDVADRGLQARPSVPMHPPLRTAA